MTMWIVEDTEDPRNSFISRTRRQATVMACNNRGYGSFRELMRDGWAKKPVKFSVPASVAAFIEVHGE